MPSWAATDATTVGGTSVGSARKRVQEPSGGQLQREPELVLCTAPHFDQLKVGGARREEVDDLVVEGRPES